MSLEDMFPPKREVPPDVADSLVYYATFAADGEAMKPRPFSAIRNPDGTRQYETPHEFTGRIVRAAVLHLVEQGLLEVPADFAERIEQPVRLDRP